MKGTVRETGQSGSIGQLSSTQWPGLGKLAEEAGEVQQVIGKLLATGGGIEHWDGSDLRERMHEELADLIAACGFVIEKNGLDEGRILARVEKKMEAYQQWASTGQ